jgi:O-antigen/teichoic acid export membrane protein
VWFMDLGLGQATIKLAAESAGRGATRELRSVFWTSTLTYLVLGTVGALLLAGVAPIAVDRWFQIPAELRDEARQSFQVGAAALFLGMVSYGPTSVLRGLERFRAVNTIAMISGSLQPILTILLVRAGLPLPGVLLANVAVALLSLIVTQSVLLRTVSGVARPTWDAAIFRRFAHFGSFTGASSVIVPLILNAEKFLLASSASVAAVTYYMVAHNASTRLAIVPSALSGALFPAFSGLDASGDRARAGTLSSQANRIIWRLFLPLIVVLAVYAPELLTLWMGAEFASHATLVLRILLLAAAVHSLAWVPHYLLQALGRPDESLRVYVIELVVCIPVAAVAIHYWGAVGAALAWLVRSLLDSLLAWSFAARLSGSRDRAWRLLGEWHTSAAVIATLALWWGRRLLSGHVTADAVLATVVGAALIVLLSWVAVRPIMASALGRRFGGAAPQPS